MKAFGIAALVFFLCAASRADTSVSYGPDAVVDTNPYGSYVEPALDVSPKNAANLVAGSMVFTAGGIGVEAFRSDDGGYHWKSSSLPTGAGALVGDVQASFNADGYAYVTALGNQPRPTGAAKNGLYVFGSADNGETFRRLAFLQTPDGHSYDHEQLAIDRTHGKYRGRIYMTVLYLLSLTPSQLNGLGIIWSSDGGRTFHGPVLVSKGWSFNSRPVVLSDGTVVFPLFHNEKQGDTKALVQVALSRDGGQTFSAPQTIGDRAVYNVDVTMKKLSSGEWDFDGDSVPQFAAGRQASRTADNVYGVWSDLREGPSRLLFTKSVDGGKHWTTPHAILVSSDATDSQYQPSMAVNANGTVGISWYNGSASRNTVSEMFAVSNDGGETFSAPAQISSVVAPIKTPGGDRYSALSFASPKGTFISFTAPGSRFPSGGDYMGLAADANGAFHPIWIDARSGFNQAWSATVFPQAASPDPAGLMKQDVTAKVELEFGIATWDVASQTLTVPMRLHNTSHDTLYPPFTISVTGTTNPYSKDSQTAVSILNADNDKAGAGATFVFAAQTVGNLGRLLPGADTSSKTLKVHIETGIPQQPVLVTNIEANVPPKSP
jgi:hypothetical protein